MLKIWGRRNSINVQKVMWTVAELGLAHQRIEAGMAHGLVGEDWYARNNPNRLVPTIEDDGTVVWESNVIIRYLAAKHSTGTLMPAGLVDRTRADMWMDWQQTTLMTGMSPMFLGLIRTPPEKRDTNAIEAGRKTAEKAFALLDAQLAGKAYVTGTAMTVADLALGPVAYRWYSLPIERPSFANLRGWYERLGKRPAFAEHVMLPLT